MSTALHILEFSHATTQGFYLVAGKVRVATATHTDRYGWRLVWTATQATPITGHDALDVISRAIDAWPALADCLADEAGSGPWNVPAEVGVSRSASPMGGQPGWRR